MSVKLEEMFNEIQQQGINSAKNVVFTGTVSTGAQTVTGAETITGAVTTQSSVAVPTTATAVAVGAGLTMFSTGIKIWVTSDAPTHTATKGDLCINTGGSSSSTRLYINNGTTNWVAVTTAS